MNLKVQVTLVIWTFLLRAFSESAMAKRPIQEQRRLAVADNFIAMAEYVGSEEHKDERWWGGLPGGWSGPSRVASRPNKQNTTICKLITPCDRLRATRWVRRSLKAGQFRFLQGDKDFPKHIWYKDDNGKFWFGFCINSVAGEYKGWPVNEEECRGKFG